ncbi:MAG: hypothetical protein ACTHVU_05295, partial [Corynebacterium sp.]
AAPDAGGRHPGESSYGAGPSGPASGPAEQELRGFQLPESERPDNPWTSDDAPTRNLRAQNGGTQDDGGRHHRRDDTDEKD